MEEMSNMKIAYLHGLESKVGGPKVDWLMSLGHKVIFPKMDYSDVNEFRDTLHLLEMYKPDLIIGSSMGGWFAWNIGKLLKVPVLLYNPAILAPTLIDAELKDSKVFLALGTSDEVINPNQTIKLLNMIDKHDWNMNNVWKGPHGHQTPLDSFQSAFLHFQNNIKHNINLYKRYKSDKI